MKKTRYINLSAMRKQVRHFALAPLALAVITGCTPEPKEQVKFVTSVDDCTANTTMPKEQCEAAYAQAVRDAEATAPRYQNLTDCTTEFGQCEKSAGGFFVPFMAGYIVSELIDGVGSQHRYRHSYPAYTYRGNGSDRDKIMTADGYVIGSVGQKNYTVKSDVLQPKPKAIIKKTVDRGGFGSKASAKSSWGSNKSSSGKSSSSKGGWGG